MLTLRRGIARVGWILLAIWMALWLGLFVVMRAQSPNPPPIDATLAFQLAAFLLGWPFAVFLVWRVILWIGQGFWQQPAAVPKKGVSTVAPHFKDKFWTVRTMALAGAFLFAAFGTVAGMGGLLSNAAIGAILGAVMGRFLPR